jgi:hypothetical protein
MKKIFLLLALFIFNLNVAHASSHRDSAFLAANPALDGTDLYAFNSYETGREDFITIITNYQPFQIPGQGPNYYSFDPTAFYEIFIDTDGDAVENHVFRFKFTQLLNNKNQGQALTVDSKKMAMPFISNGAVSNTNAASLARQFGYTIQYFNNGEAYSYKASENAPIKGKFLTKASTVTIPELVDFDDTKTFTVPENNIGSNSFADYDAYASAYIYDAVIPDKKCKTNARVFVGPRQESFKANLSGIYDSASKNLQGSENGSVNEFAGYNTLSIAIEIPKACLNIREKNPVIGIWSTSSTPARKIIKNKPTFAKFSLFSTNSFVQSSRLGNPLVNLLLIGYKDKNLFNTTIPRNDLKKNFDDYISYPAIAEYIESKSSLVAPNLFPRTDLQEVFLTGIEGLNKSTGKKGKAAKQADILRLNTTTPALAKGAQNRLGVLGGDNAGYPNGRRPGDDVVDIFFRLLFGARINDVSLAPSKNLSLTDGVTVSDQDFSDSFPYL